MEDEKDTDPVTKAAVISRQGTGWIIRFPFGRIEVVAGYDREGIMEFAEGMLRASAGKGWEPPCSSPLAA